MNEANPLPDESLLAMPDEWQATLLPRRGVRPGDVFEPDADALARWRDLLEVHAPQLRPLLRSPELQCAVEYLDGRPNPLGAGLVAEMVVPESPEHPNSMVRPVLDAWIAEHGLPFAVGAALAFMSFESQRGSTSPTFGSLVEYDLRRLRIRPLESMSGILFLDQDFHAIRGLLADASAAEYAEAEAVVDRLRDNPVRKFLAAFFLPDRADWVDEAAAEIAALGWSGHLKTKLAHSMASRSQVAATGMRCIEPWEQSVELLAAMVDGLGAEALPVFTAKTSRPLDANDRRERMQAIAMIPHDDAAAHLVGHLAEEFVFEAATAAARRYPVRMLRAVAAHAPEAAPERRPLLAGLVRIVDARARDAVAASERAALDELEALVRPVPAADAADLPELLVRPPWTVERAERKPVVVKGLKPNPEPRVVWAEGEREQYLEDAAEFDPGDTDWERRAHYRHLNLDGLGEVLAYAPKAVTDQYIDSWNGDLGRYYEPYMAAHVQAILARFGSGVAAHLVKYLGSNPRLGALMVPILTPEAARIAAHWFAKFDSPREHGAAWLDRHGAAGAELLVPSALGAAKARRTPAEAALVHIERKHGRAAVLEAAAVYGEEARDAIAALLDAPPVDALPYRVPEPGPWFDPSLLPQVLLRGGEYALPEESLRHVAVLLAISASRPDDPRLAVLAETCDHDSLRGFSWSVFEQWIAGGAPAADRWTLIVLSHFGNDETVARLTPLIKEWPGQSQHHRAVAGLKVLGGIGSEAALRAMQHVAQRAKFKAIKAEAVQQIKVIAAGLGLSGEQLADRLLPDFGLGKDGVLVLDYGPRRFRVVFDEQLKPYVADESGKPRKSLPKPGAKDDPELAGPAYRRFTELKKELRAVAVDQVRRLEAAMINARTWEAEEFEQYLHGHPLMRHLTRRMIWLGEAEGRRFTFRVAEDHSFSDAADDTVELPNDAVIRLAHPVDMTPEECLAWGQILADYEILQPFPQLSRPVMAFTELELKTGRLERFENAVVTAGSILGLTKHGWVRGKPQDNGTEFGFHFPLPTGGYLAVELDPGLQIGMGADVEDQRLEAVYLTDRLDHYYRKQAFGHATDIDPVTASEVLAALDRITAEA